MQSTDDSSLLRQYVENRSDDAFSTLVARHVNLVYSVAMRQVGNPGQAEEITQAVFIILAKKAGQLRHDKALSSWLFQTTRLTVNNFIRSETRRLHREQEAYMQSALNESGSDVWPQIAPLLDAAVAGLNEKDRRAIVLRFYEGKNLQEVGATLGANEDAAQKRVNRAVEKLRQFFTKRGVVVPAAVLLTAMAANSVQAAPATLTQSAAAMALTKGATASASTLTLTKGTLKIMTWIKIKTAALTGAAILLTAGTGVVVGEAVTTAQSPAPPDLTGIWEGTLFVPPGLHTRLVFKITKENGAYHMLEDVVDQGMKNVSMANPPDGRMDYNYPSVLFDFNSKRSSRSIYAATMNADGTELSGTIAQHGESHPLVMKRTSHPTPVPNKLQESDYAPRVGSDLQGFWAGAFKAGTNSWLYYFKIAEQPDGSFRAEADGINDKVEKLELLAQGWKDIPAISVLYKKPTVTLDFSGVGRIFKGGLNKEKTELRGTWSWGKGTLPLTMKRADPATEDRRVAPVVGIGTALTLDEQTHALVITQVLPNSPAATGGLLAGQIIQRVDETDLTGKNLNECVALLRGRVGSITRLVVFDPKTKTTNTVELVRQIIPGT